MKVTKPTKIVLCRGYESYQNHVNRGYEACQNRFNGCIEIDTAIIHRRK